MQCQPWHNVPVAAAVPVAEVVRQVPLRATPAQACHARRAAHAQALRTRVRRAAALRAQVHPTRALQAVARVQAVLIQDLHRAALHVPQHIRVLLPPLPAVAATPARPTTAAQPPVLQAPVWEKATQDPPHRPLAVPATVRVAQDWLQHVLSKAA